MVQNTSDIFYSVDKYCQAEILCYADIKYQPYNWYICKQLILFQEDVVKVSLTIHFYGIF